MAHFYRLGKLPESISELPENETGEVAAVMTEEEWRAAGGGILADYKSAPKYPVVRNCKAEVYPFCTAGTVTFPDRGQFLEKRHFFSFYITVQSVLILTEDGAVRRAVERVVKFGQDMTKGKFFFALLEAVTLPYAKRMDRHEERLGEMEEALLEAYQPDFLEELLHIRKECQTLCRYYRQMEDVARELEEDEAECFRREEERYFHLCGDRIRRLGDLAAQQMETCMELRELLQAQQDRRANKTMQFLTVLTSIFFPLTLIAGWYGMNFEYMPELHSRYGYLAVIGISLLVVAAGIFFWKRKKPF